MKSLDAGEKLEISFVVKKFLELSIKDKERIFKLIKKNDNDSRAEVSKELLALLTDNSEEMGKFAGPFDAWAVFSNQVPHKEALFWGYFKEKILNINGDIRIPPAV